MLPAHHNIIIIMSCVYAIITVVFIFGVVYYVNELLANLTRM